MSSDDQSPALVIEYRPVGRTGRTVFVCLYGDKRVHQGVINLCAAHHADTVKTFVDSIYKARPDVASREVVEQLMADRVADAFTELLLEDDASSAPASQASDLVAMTEPAYLFRTPGADPDTYATVTECQRRRTWPVRSKGFKQWLIAQFFAKNNKAPGSQALQDALNTISAKAASSQKSHNVHLRVAERDGALWLDLADEGGSAIEITPTGWGVVQGCEVPVAFIRRMGTLGLPTPVRGGSVDELRPFINVASEDDFYLVVAWLIAALRPGYPFAVLDITGEQGSAKSTMTKVLRKLIDPNLVPVRSLSRSLRELFITANNSRLVVFENVSNLPPWISDGLCMLATGGGFGTRELYSDDDEKLFVAMRPVMLNGIAAVVERSDLLDRSLSIVLPRIPSESRMTEQDFWQRFEECWPRLLGALLDVVSAALGNIDQVHLAAPPRMADFAHWVVAAEPALGWPPGSFLDAYRRNREVAHETAVETSALGPALTALLRQHSGRWAGPATELLAALEEHCSERTRRRKDWPKSPSALSGKLRRLAPNLRETGCEVTFLDREARRRKIVLRMTAIEDDASTPSSLPSSPSHETPLLDPSVADHDGDDSDDGDLPPCSNAAQQLFSGEEEGTDPDEASERHYRWD